jgi:hypothetical protein
MINRLTHLVQDPYIPAGVGSSGEYRFPEIISRNNLGA